MSTVAGVFMLAGSIVAVLAGVGLLRFETSYARMHAAGKASPVAFLIAAIGAALQIDAGGVAYIAIAAVAMILTLPVGVHLLFRAVHRTTAGDHLVVDDLGRSGEDEAGSASGSGASDCGSEAEAGAGPEAGSASEGGSGS
ncbi:MAG: monovalent cation/H(+) antiporter subunit G [Actinomycetota bacterium]